MATINLSILTIPTPEPYDAAHPHKQREHLCFVLLQMLWQAKQAEWAESDTTSAGGGGSVDLSGVIEAIQSLAYNGQELDLGDMIIRLTSRSTTLDAL